MKVLMVVLSAFLFVSTYAQDNLQQDERFPVFTECENVNYSEQENCFYNQIRAKVMTNFELPDAVAEDNYQGKITVLFEVTPEGKFRVIYVDAVYDELKQEAEKVFTELDDVKPATYNGNPIYAV